MAQKRIIDNLELPLIGGLILALWYIADSLWGAQTSKIIFAGIATSFLSGAGIISVFPVAKHCLTRDTDLGKLEKYRLIVMVGLLYVAHEAVTQFYSHIGKVIF